jgi:hypothetical protein
MCGQPFDPLGDEPPRGDQQEHHRSVVEHAFAFPRNGEEAAGDREVAGHEAAAEQGRGHPVVDQPDEQGCGQRDEQHAGAVRRGADGDDGDGDVDGDQQRMCGDDVERAPPGPRGGRRERARGQHGSARGAVRRHRPVEDDQHRPEDAQQKHVQAQLDDDAGARGLHRRLTRPARR